MADSTLIHEFHSDHAQMVQALMDLRGSIQARNPAGVRATLESANKLTGPHFKFEELHLYPKLREFVGEAGMQRPLMEHDGIFRSVTALVTLAAKRHLDRSRGRICAGLSRSDLGTPDLLRRLGSLY